MQTMIEENIRNIRQKIIKNCAKIKKSSDEITLIAVSKRKDHKLIEEAINCGITNFGENYAQELEKKSKLLSAKNIIWHYIGPIQSNKVKIIAKHANWVHTLEREKIIKRLNTECSKINKTINACIQINISSENTKSGCEPSELIEIATLIESMKNINLKGIMVLPKLLWSECEKDNTIKLINTLSLDLQKKFPSASAISFGTTSDFESAILNGSNMVRIGESIFGKRL